MDPTSSIKVQIYGRVTGVGFRCHALDFASGMPGLKGYVRNMGSGHVEAFLQGPKGEVMEMLAWLRKGPSGAIVERVELSDSEPDPEIQDFTIRNTWRE